MDANRELEKHLYALKVKHGQQRTSVTLKCICLFFQIFILKILLQSSLMFDVLETEKAYIKHSDPYDKTDYAYRGGRGAI